MQMMQSARITNTSLFLQRAGLGGLDAGGHQPGGLQRQGAQHALRRLWQRVRAAGAASGMANSVVLHPGRSVFLLDATVCNCSSSCSLRGVLQLPAPPLSQPHRWRMTWAVRCGDELPAGTPGTSPMKSSETVPSSTLALASELCSWVSAGLTVGMPGTLPLTPSKADPHSGRLAIIDQPEVSQGAIGPSAGGRQAGGRDIGHVSAEAERGVFRGGTHCVKAGAVADAAALQPRAGDLTELWDVS